MEPQYLTYGLVDPRTKLIRYVGCSSCGLKRPRQHMNPRENRANPKKAMWIRDLRTAGLVFEIVVLEETTLETWKTDEIWWIAFGRACGWPLVNLTDGGDGTLGYKPSAETRAKFSAYHKGRKHSAEHIARVAAANRGKKISESQRAKLRAANLGRKQSPESIAKRVAKAIGRKMPPRPPPAPPPGMRINLRPAKFAVTATTKAKFRAAKLGRKQSPEHVAKRAASQVGKKRTPEHRAALSAAQRLRFGVITHCPKGHEYTPGNLRGRPGKGPECRECGRIKEREYKRAKRAAKKEAT